MIKKGTLTKYEKQSKERIRFLIQKYCEGNQQQFADLTGINKASVSQYVNGKNTPSNTTAAKIGEVFNINPAWINGFDVPMKTVNDSSSADNVRALDAYAVPILGKIACGNGSFLEDSFNGEFIVDRSIKADYCLIASGDSMIDAGIEDGDRVLLKKAEDFHDGSIYGVIIMGEDIATLKKVYRTDSGYLLQPCNASGDYRPMFVNEEEVCFAGECVGVYKSI